MLEYMDLPTTTGTYEGMLLPIVLDDDPGDLDTFELYYGEPTGTYEDMCDKLEIPFNERTFKERED